MTLEMLEVSVSELKPHNWISSVIAYGALPHSIRVMHIATNHRYTIIEDIFPEDLMCRASSVFFDKVHLRVRFVEWSL